MPPAPAFAVVGWPALRVCAVGDPRGLRGFDAGGCLGVQKSLALPSDQHPVDLVERLR